MGMRRLGTRHAPEVPNDHTNLTSTASDEHMRALVPHMRTQHAPSTGTTGWQRVDQAQTPDPYRENPGGGFPRGALATRAGSLCDRGAGSGVGPHGVHAGRFPAGKYQTTSLKHQIISD